MIRQQPGSTQGDEAKKRIDELRSKVGDAEVQQIPAVANAPKKKPNNGARRRTATRRPCDAPSPADVAPLPPPERRFAAAACFARARYDDGAGGFANARSVGDTREHARRRRREVFSRRGYSAVFGLAGCAGYTIGPAKPAYLRDIHAIAVPTFKNSTLHPRIEVLVTSTVIKQFQQDGTFRIVERRRRRCHLERRRSLDVGRSPARSVRGNVLATTEFDLSMRVRYSLVGSRRQS